MADDEQRRDGGKGREEGMLLAIKSWIAIMESRMKREESRRHIEDGSETGKKTDDGGRRRGNRREVSEI